MQGPCEYAQEEKTIILFSDEKVFDIDSVSNSHLDRYLSSEKVEDVPDHVKFKYQTKHPASIIVFGLISSDVKKMPPYFFPVCTKIDSEVYIDMLKKIVRPGCKLCAPTGWSSLPHV